MRLKAPGSLLLAAGAAVLLGATHAPGQAFTNRTPSARTPAKPGMDASDCLSVSGTNLAHRSAVTTWAAENAARLERAIGDVIPSRGRVYRIVLGAPSAGTVARQAFVADGLFIQTLFVPDVESADHEDMLESFCAMLLASWIPAAGAGTQAVDPPDYLSVGLAQNLHASLRARNRRVGLQLLGDGRFPAMADVLAWDTLPPGRWTSKAVSGLALGYVLAHPDSSALLRRLAALLARGDRVTAEWLAAAMLGPDATSASLDADWHTWLRREQERAVEDLGAVSSSLIARLRATLVLSPREVGFEGDAADGPVALDSLIARRREPAVRALAADRSERLLVLAIGKDPEFVAAVDGYRRFLNGVAAGRAAFFLRRWLRQASERAEALARLVKAREDYVTAAEQALQPPIPGPESLAPPPGAPKDSIDRPERRFNNPPAGAESGAGSADTKP